MSSRPDAPREGGREEQLGKFCQIVREGGTIVCAPDTYATLCRIMEEEGVVPTFDTIRQNRHLPKGYMVAVAKRAWKDQFEPLAALSPESGTPDDPGQVSSCDPAFVPGVVE